jgi:hypothetical protein
VILLIPTGERTTLGLPYLFLPLALAGFVTFALISVEWLARLFVDQDEGSK